MPGSLEVSGDQNPGQWPIFRPFIGALMRQECLTLIATLIKTANKQKQKQINFFLDINNK